MIRPLLAVVLTIVAGVLVYYRHRQEQRDAQTICEQKDKAWSGMPKKYRYVPGMEQPSAKVRPQPWWQRRKRSA